MEPMWAITVQLFYVRRWVGRCGCVDGCYVLVRPRTDVKKTMGKALLVHTYLTVPTFISNPYPQLYQLPTTPTPTLGHAGAAKVRAGAERYNGLA